MTEPQHGTRRRLERPTLGRYLPRIAALFGLTVKPFQQHFVDVLGELVVDEATGVEVPAYSSASVSVGRRAGKTTGVFMYAILRQIKQAHCAAYFTMQNRNAMAELYRDEWVPMLEDSPIGHRVKLGMGNGTEYWRFPNRSVGRLFAPTRKAMHGKSASLVVLDECWATEPERGEEIEIGAGPALWTNPGSQFIKHSAAGNADSTYWAGILEAGREAVEADTGSGRCHLEWTVDGTDLDEEDPRVWRAVHPGGLPMAVMQAEFDADPELFRRTILNVTDAQGSRTVPIDVNTWGLQVVEHELERGGLLTVGVDVAPNEETAVVVIGFAGGEVEVVDHRPGSGWVLAVLVDLFSRYAIHSCTLDPAGPAGVLIVELEAAGLPVNQPPQRVVNAAAAGFARAVNTGTSRHRYDASLDIAVTGARKRRSGDGAWGFSRTASLTDVGPLIAASLAWHQHPEVHNAGPAYIGVH